MTYRKLTIGSVVASSAVGGRTGKVLGLNRAGFYTVRWIDATDVEGMRCVDSGEVKQYRRDEIVALNTKGRPDDKETGSAASFAAEDNLLDTGDLRNVTFKPHADSPVLDEEKPASEG